MSAIAGILYLDGRPAEAATVDMMLAAMAHRGPDHAETWADGPIAFGCRLLRTTPESSSERLPLCDGARGIAITADARIDNREALLAALNLPGADAALLPDSTIILAAYARWGPACVEKFLGDFSFAIWDPRERTLFCARDHFGVRPFIYCQTDRFLAFASEIGGLLALADVPRRIDESQVLEYLSAYYEDTSSTFYRDIRKLPPAHGIVVKNGALSKRRYWTLAHPPDRRPKSDAENIETFRDIFIEAVRCRVRSSGAVGAALSGGLNSSSVALAARRLLLKRNGSPLHTFSLVFDDVPQSDERSYQQAALAAGDMVPRTIRGDRIGPLLELERVIDHMGEPFLAPNLFLHWEMYRAAKASGTAVFLDGLDGDTTVSHGTARITELALAGRWPTLLREVRTVSRRFNTPMRSVFRTRVIAPIIPDRLRAIRRRLFGQQSFGPPTRLQLNEAFARRTNFAARAAEFAYADRKMPVTEKAAHLRSLSRGLLSRVLDVADRASAAFSIEARYPFLRPAPDRILSRRPGKPEAARWLDPLDHAPCDGWDTSGRDSVARRKKQSRTQFRPHPAYDRSRSAGRDHRRHGRSIGRVPRHEGVAHAARPVCRRKDDVRRTSRHARSDPRRVASPHGALARCRPPKNVSSEMLRLLCRRPHGMITSPMGCESGRQFHYPNSLPCRSAQPPFAGQTRQGGNAAQPVDGCDVLVQIDTVEPPPRDAIALAAARWIKGRAVWRDYPGTCRMLVREGREIVIEPAPRVDERALRLVVLGNGVGMILHQRGLLVLHASAVAIAGAAVVFSGFSGAGKSTIAAALNRRGHPLVADDVVAVRAEPDGYVVLPGFPQVKLSPEVAEISATTIAI